MKDLKGIIDQLESVSYDDFTKELSASVNALVIVGNVQKLKGSEDCIVVSPLNDDTRRFQFRTQDIDRIEKMDNQVFKVFIKVDSSCTVMFNGKTMKSSAITRGRKRFDFERMQFLSYRSSVSPCYLICDSRCDINCDSCYTDCYCTCICDCNYVA
jgi:hypothetical protein